MIANLQHSYGETELSRGIFQKQELFLRPRNKRQGKLRR